MQFGHSSMISKIADYEAAPSMPKMAEHAIKVLICLALAPGRFLSAGAIAQCVRLRTTQTAEVLHLLTWRGFTRSRRGSSGGYALRVKAEEIAVSEVMELFHPIRDPDVEPASDPLLQVWSEVADKYQQAWGQRTIAELARQTANQWECSMCPASAGTG